MLFSIAEIKFNKIEARIFEHFVYEFNIKSNQIKYYYITLLVNKSLSFKIQNKKRKCIFCILNSENFNSPNRLKP